MLADWPGTITRKSYGSGPFLSITIDHSTLPRCAVRCAQIALTRQHRYYHPPSPLSSHTSIPSGRCNVLIARSRLTAEHAQPSISEPFLSPYPPTVWAARPLAEFLQPLRGHNGHLVKPSTVLTIRRDRVTVTRSLLASPLGSDRYRPPRELVQTPIVLSP